MNRWGQAVFTKIAVCLIAFTYLSCGAVFHSLDGIPEIVSVFLPMSFYRGISDLSVGCLTYFFVQKNGTVLNAIPFSKRYGIITVITCLGFYFSFAHPHTNCEFLAIFGWAICIGLVNSAPDSSKRADPMASGGSRVISFLGSKMYVLYCYQAIAFILVSWLSRRFPVTPVVVLAVAVLTAACFDCLYEYGLRPGAQQLLKYFRDTKQI